MSDVSDPWLAPRPASGRSGPTTTSSSWEATRCWRSGSSRGALRTFQVELPVRALFESPAVADMAIMIVQNQAAKAGQEEVERMQEELEGLSREEARKRGTGDGL
jgi:hypothetical protein